MRKVNIIKMPRFAVSLLRANTAILKNSFSCITAKTAPNRFCCSLSCQMFYSTGSSDLF